MDRTTTRDEYKAFMRKYRAMLSILDTKTVEWKSQRDVADMAFHASFSAVYDVIPKEFFSMKGCSIRHKPMKPSARTEHFQDLTLTTSQTAIRTKRGIPDER